MAAGAVFLLLSAAYLSAIPRAYSYDGLCYALDVQYGPPINLFHANHLLFGASMRALYRLAGWMGYHGPAIVLMQVTNALAAAAAAGILVITLAPRLGLWAAIAGATAMGATSGVWSQATDPGCYGWTLAAACALLALWFRAGRWPAWAVGVCHGVAVLMHQLLLLPAAAFVAAQPTARRRVEYAAGLVAVIVAVYGWVGFRFHGPGLVSVLAWMTQPADAYASPSGVVFWSWSGIANPMLSVRSLAATVADGAWGWGLAGAVAVAAVAGTLARPWSKRLWLWPAVLFLFQLFYMPAATTYRLLSWPVLFAWAAAGLTRLRQPAWRMALSAGIALGLAWQWQAAVQRARQPSMDHVRTEWVRSVTRPADFFVFAGRGQESILNVHLAYFAPAVRARSLYGYLFTSSSGDFSELERRMRDVEAAGGRVLIEAALETPETQRLLESERRLPVGTLASFLSRWTVTARLQGPGDYGIRVTESKPQ